MFNLQPPTLGSSLQTAFQGSRVSQGGACGIIWVPEQRKGTEGRAEGVLDLLLQSALTPPLCYLYHMILSQASF